MAAVILSVVLLLARSWFLNPSEFQRAGLLFWVVAVAAIELLPVPVTSKIQLSLAFPILLAVGIIYSPYVAAFVALIGSFDPRELKREISLTKSLFNRCQLAFCHLAGSAAFHSVASVHSPLPRLIPSALMATAVIFTVNVTFVTMATHLLYQVSFENILRQLRLGALHEFLLNYLGLGFVAVLVARLYEVPDISVLAVAAFILPLIFARQMFFRNLALQEAHKELKDREQVMRALSNRMAEERQDERMRIAAYLHDDLAQMLFRLNLQAEMAKKRLVQGDTHAVIKDLEGILRTKQDTSDAIRALIRDLHRSPIGRRGLAEAIQSFAEDMTRGGATKIVTDVVEVSLPPPIQLLIYQISREGAMNALKHAEASEIKIVLEEKEDGVELTIADDGRGFDTSAPPPEGHFGSVMMRERALVAGGTYSIHSQPGEGTRITATFPRVWVEEGTKLEADAAGPHSNGQGGGQEPPVGTSVGPPRAPETAAGRTSASKNGKEAEGWLSLPPEDRPPSTPKEPVGPSPDPADPDPRAVPA